jgi:hypothetical protein
MSLFIILDSVNITYIDGIVDSTHPKEKEKKIRYSSIPSFPSTGNRTPSTDWTMYVFGLILINIMRPAHSEPISVFVRPRKSYAH